MLGVAPTVIAGRNETFPDRKAVTTADDERRANVDDNIMALSRVPFPIWDRGLRTVCEDGV